MTTSTHA